jgi:peptide methionine sulfoxide reductase MsrA
MVNSLLTSFTSESSHQQYLSDTKNPDGYCACPIGVAKFTEE